MKMTYTNEEVLTLLAEERQRAVDIAYEFYHKAEAEYKAKLKAEIKVFGREQIAFVKNEVANECRLVGNAISNRSVFGENETLEQIISKEFNYKNK